MGDRDSDRPVSRMNIQIEKDMFVKITRIFIYSSILYYIMQLCQFVMYLATRHTIP